MNELTPEKEKKQEPDSAPSIGDAPLCSDEETEEVLSDQDSDDEPDLEKINSALGMYFQPDINGSYAKKMQNILDVVEEIAEDMLELRKYLRETQKSQEQLKDRLEHLEQSIHASSVSNSRRLNKLHSELAGDRKGMLMLGALDALSPFLRSLRVMRAGLDKQIDERIDAQAHALERNLVNVLRRLGYQEFHVEEGEPIDSAKMEGAGYGNGESGIVLEESYPGYTVNGVVVKPAGIIIAEPTKPGEEDSSSTDASEPPPNGDGDMPAEETEEIDFSEEVKNG